MTASGLNASVIVGAILRKFGETSIEISQQDFDEILKGYALDCHGNPATGAIVYRITPINDETQPDLLPVTDVRGDTRHVPAAGEELRVFGELRGIDLAPPVYCGPNCRGAWTFTGHATTIHGAGCSVGPVAPAIGEIRK